MKQDMIAPASCLGYANPDVLPLELLQREQVQIEQKIRDSAGTDRQLRRWNLQNNIISEAIEVKQLEAAGEIEVRRDGQGRVTGYKYFPMNPSDRSYPRKQKRVNKKFQRWLFRNYGEKLNFGESKTRTF